MILTIVAVVLAGMLAGIPFAFSLLLGTTLATLVFDPSGLLNLPLLAMSDINNPLLIAIPMLIIAGEMLSAGGAIEPIVEAWEWLFGRIRGSLGLCCVATSMFFAGSTGSSAAEAAAVASAFQSPMEKRGYGRGYVASLVVAATAIGILFPPSIAMILYSQVVNYSVTALWVAGIFPGLIAGVLIAITGVFVAHRKLGSSPAEGRFSRSGPRLGRRSDSADGGDQGQAVSTDTGSPPSARNRPPGSSRATATVPVAVPATTVEMPALQGARKVVATVSGLLIPVCVVGGIYSGILTLSEVSAALIAVIVLYGLFITRIGGRRLFDAARVGGQRAGAVFLIVIAARLFSSVLTEQQTITGLLTTVQHLHLSKFVMLLLANIVMLGAGALMDGLSLILIGAPILYQLLAPFGISPVHLAIIMAINLEIGVMHPPLGGNLFAVSAVTGVRVGRISIDVLPYIGVLLFVLALVTYVPVPGFAWS